MRAQSIANEQDNQFDQGGFTLVELALVIVLLGILAVVAFPLFSDLTESSKVSATKQEMLELKKAIAGNARIVAAGKHVDRGYEGDIGVLPTQLTDLVTMPAAVVPYDRLTRLGWNGPYIDGNDNSYLNDAWGVAYVYQPATRQLVSVGGTASITVSF